MRVILGVDPGSRVTGYAFLRVASVGTTLPRDLEVLDAGVLRVDGTLSYPVRLGLLHGALYGLIERHRPDVAVLEKAFCAKNAGSAIKLGELRGAYVAACARAAVPVDEITPAEVKKTITGNGRAEKEMVSLALRTLTGFDRGGLPHDVTDAVAIGFCYALRLAPRWAGDFGHAATRLVVGAKEV